MEIKRIVRTLERVRIKSAYRLSDSLQNNQTLEEFISARNKEIETIDNQTQVHSLKALTTRNQSAVNRYGKVNNEIVKIMDFISEDLQSPKSNATITINFDDINMGTSYRGFETIKASTCSGMTRINEQFLMELCPQQNKKKQVILVDKMKAGLVGKMIQKQTEQAQKSSNLLDARRITQLEVKKAKIQGKVYNNVIKNDGEPIITAKPINPLLKILSANSENKLIDTEQPIIRKMLSFKNSPSVKPYQSDKIVNKELAKILCQFRIQMFPKLSDFVNQMRETGQIKTVLVKELEKMHINIKNPGQEFIMGFQKKYEQVVSLGHEVDDQKIKYIQVQITLLYMSEKFFLESHSQMSRDQNSGVQTGKITEVLIGLREMIRLATKVPDHMLASRLFELQGTLYKSVKNYNAAIKSFHKMRDVAQDCSDRVQEMKAYKQLGICLHQLGKHENAILAFKRQMQVAWVFDDHKYEINALEQIGKQYFYLGALQKSHLYIQTSLRGQTEPLDSKIRIMVKTMYQDKIKEKNDIFRQFNIDKNSASSKKMQLESCMQDLEEMPKKIMQIQKNSLNGYYKQDLDYDFSKQQDNSSKEDLEQNKRQEFFKKLQLIESINQNIDRELEKTNKIRRVCTPIQNVNPKDLPSPVHTNNEDGDEAQLERKKFKTYKPPTDFLADMRVVSKIAFDFSVTRIRSLYAFAHERKRC